MSFKSLGFVLSIPLFVACAAGDKEVDSKPFVINGKETDTTALPATLATIYDRNACTATVLDSGRGNAGTRTLLTAAHCVALTVTPGLDHENYVQGQMPIWYSRAKNLQNDRLPIDVVSISIHPDFAKVYAATDEATRLETASFTTPDVAIVVVKGLPQDIPGAQIDFQNPVKEGDPVTIAGYGCNEFSTKKHAGILRKGQTKVAFVEQGRIVLNGGTGGREALACPGDSGGALFPAGNPLLIRGINSEGGLFATRVVPLHRGSPAGDWLLKKLGQAPADRAESFDGEAKALVGTWLKVSAKDSAGLTTGTEKCFLPKGSVLAVSAKETVGKHLRIRLKFADVSCPSFTADSYVFSEHFELKAKN